MPTYGTKLVTCAGRELIAVLLCPTERTSKPRTVSRAALCADSIRGAIRRRDGMYLQREGLEMIARRSAPATKVTSGMAQMPRDQMTLQNRDYCRLHQKARSGLFGSGVTSQL